MDRLGGVRVPQDRLRNTLVGAFALIPLYALLLDKFTHYTDGTTCLVLNMLCLFTYGPGMRVISKLH